MYTQSLGNHTEGCPQEILDGASLISSETISFTMPGPTDCTEDHTVDPREEGDDVANAQCVGVIHGGFDDVGSMRLWESVMQRYKVVQTCAQ